MRSDGERRLSQRRRQHREALALGASGALHLAVLLAFLWITPAIHTFQAPAETSVAVDLIAPIDIPPDVSGVPAVTAQQARQSARSSGATRSKAAARPRAAPITSPAPPAPPAKRTAPTTSNPAASPSAPAAPRPVAPRPGAFRPGAPRPGANASRAAGRGAATGAGLQAGPFAGEDDGGDVRAFLRTSVGCSHQDYLNLNKAERDECHRQFGAAGAKVAGRVDAIPSGMRAYYDAVQQARRDIHDYSALGKPPGYGLSAGCAHGKCGVTLPSGVLTEESNIPPP